MSAMKQNFWFWISVLFEGRHK